MDAKVLELAKILPENAVSPLIHEYLERLGGFLKDGYCLRHATKTDKACIARLKHMCNGNEIILHVDLERRTFVQYTNKLLKFIMVYD